MKLGETRAEHHIFAVKKSDLDKTNLDWTIECECQYVVADGIPEFACRIARAFCNASVRVKSGGSREESRFSLLILPDLYRRIDVQLGKTTVNWKYRISRSSVIVLAITNSEFSPLPIRADQIEHISSTPLSGSGMLRTASNVSGEELRRRSKDRVQVLPSRNAWPMRLPRRMSARGSIR